MFGTSKDKKTQRILKSSTQKAKSIVAIFSFIGFFKLQFSFKTKLVAFTNVVLVNTVACTTADSPNCSDKIRYERDKV